MDLASSAVGGGEAGALAKGSTLLTKASKVTRVIGNPLPRNKRYAIVMSRKYAERIAKGKGKLSGSTEAWITAANDLRHVTSVEGAAKRLTLIDKNGSLRLHGDTIVEFNLPNLRGISSPFNRTNPGYIKGGRTGGGAREWLIPSDTKITNIKIRSLER